uniref:TACO1/YebC-like second and third domain-containing protein n=1 Tax=Hyaloperonospora arabidopsidis (strain Emoy2) TaxID=559515 RepID=M4C2G2_HYAAE
MRLQSVRWMGRGPTIQGKKTATDAKRTATNAKLAREIMVISKSVAGDVNNVVRGQQYLKLDLVRATDGIAAATFLTSRADVDNAEAVLYEASGPAGSALMIETLTDNKRRTAPALRHILSKFGGVLGTNGSVSWMFERKGYLEIELPVGSGDQPEMDEDALMEIALDAGAEDVEMHDGLAQVVCDPSGLASVRKCFTEAGLEPTLCELVYNPKEFLNLETEQRENFDKLVDALNEDDDVNQIHHNINE